ncbi:hypothetical protein A1O7_09538 [Cladophialophora yegresii CBS 114405]|uniref:CENP-V/GFA domain-containing protein n=1 Tax=Cladophialophora yegresii CBS 114405 TaxID=1182544 RepID=W9VPY3_9EURO|nr:uncharacterized protein A1O7_09538 [Cladophialophora yegresii CBS 114405]EXJ54201.1 hypothetical protein A1O7_09538 [Cladophialophora yegresii CBS 114405]
MDIKAKVECHCKLTSFSVPIPSSSLPLKASICHCHSCRHSSGQIFATWAVIPLPLPADIVESGNFVKYAVSTCERWSCKRCGASVINVDKASDPPEWEVATGVLNFDDASGLEGKLNRVQLWVADVKGDGGAVGWINKGRLKGMDRRWKSRRSDVVSDETVKELMTPQARVAGDNDERLPVQCRCQSVQFEIKRPDKDYNAGTGKFDACLDACDSCRAVTGFEITSWTAVPKVCVVVEPRLDTFLEDRSKLGHYQTSSNISRYFCLKCGAAVFYYKHGGQTIDIATGLLESKIEGAVRVEAWLDWQKAFKEAYEMGDSPEFVLFRDDAVDDQFVSDVAEGMRLWHKERGG